MRTAAQWRAALRELPAVAAVSVLLVAVFAYRSALQDRNERISAANDHLVRLATIDRLTGARLPEIDLAAADGTAVSFAELARRRAVWILAPDECAGCLEDVAEWNLAGSAGGTKLSIVFTGVSLQRARHLASVGGVRIPFAVDENSVTRRSLGLALPSTYLAVAADGTVVMADAGTEEMRCRPGFPSRIKYMESWSRHVADTLPQWAGETP